MTNLKLNEVTNKMTNLEKTMVNYLEKCGGFLKMSNDEEIKYNQMASEWDLLKLERDNIKANIKVNDTTVRKLHAVMRKANLKNKADYTITISRFVKNIIAINPLSKNELSIQNILNNVNITSYLHKGYVAVDIK
jgi:hypothetical protein